MKFTTTQLINALQNEYDFLAHEGLEEGDMTPEEYAEYLKGLSYQQLVEEAATDEHFTLEEFVENYGD
jgi:hypothetical protein